MSKFEQDFNNRDKILKGFSAVQNIPVPAVPDSVAIIWGLCTFVFLVINVLPFAEKVRTVYVSIRLADPGSVAIDPILF